MLARKKIAVIGAGKLGETLIKALLEAKVVQPEQIAAAAVETEAFEEKNVGRTEPVHALASRQLRREPCNRSLASPPAGS